MIRALVVIAACALLGACSAITGPRSEFTLYTLNPPAPTSATAAGASTDWHLAIDEPHALGLLATDRLVVAPDANQRLAFAGVRWNERAPVIVQDLWLRAFQADGRIGGVVRHPSGARVSLVLATDLVAFQIEQQGGSAEAVVTVHARLVEARGRRSIAQAPFSARVATDGTSGQAAVEAMERAVAGITPQLIDWAVTAGGRAISAD